MKKIFALVLALLLCVSSLQLSVYATSETKLPETIDSQKIEKSTEGTVESSKTNESTDVTSSNQGKIKVIINTQYFQKNIDSFDVTLSGSGNNYPVKTDTSNKDSRVFSFKDLADGIYTLLIKNKGYETISKEVTVNNNESVIKYVNTNSIADNIEKSGFGTIAYGDFNEDGVIDVSDKQLLLSAIMNGTYDSLMDYDNNKKIDLLDLRSFTDVYTDQENKDIVKRLQPTIEIMPLLVDNAILKEDEVTGVIEGNIKNIFDENANTESVKLKLTNPAQEISAENPVQMSFDITKPVDTTKLTIQGTEDNAITEGTITVIDSNGNEIVVPITNARTRMARSLSTGHATVSEDGTIVIDLGTQIAVKKVTIRVTATSSKKLAEISKVEFLNDMAAHIPTPKLDIPQGLVADELDAQLLVKWDALNNVTGYKIKVTFEGKTEEYSTNINSYKLKKFNNKDLINGKTYEIAVKAINDADKDSLWESEYSNVLKATPQAAKVPDAPDNVSAVGGYRTIQVSWKDMKNTDSYNVFYREKGTDTYTKAVGEYTGTSYTISSLKDNTTYQVYVSGNNKIGTGVGSLVSEATTTNVMPAILPQYKAVNTSNGIGNLSAHIKNVYYGAGANGVTKIVNSPLDEKSTTANSALALVDNNYGSYMEINDWDFGMSYHRVWRLTFEFDNVYEMNYISFAGPVNDSSINGIGISYYDENNKEVDASIDTFRKKTDVNGRIYYIAHLAKPIKTNKVRFGVQSSARNIRLAEFTFHYYDSLESDVDSLFTDSFHLSLRDDVDASLIEKLQLQLDTSEEISKEYHPFRDLIQLELNQAKQVLEGTALQNIQEIHNGITAKKQTNLGFGGLNSWQPLGYVTYPSDTFIVYVGQVGKRNGQSVNLQLVYSQYHAESSSFMSNPIQLKVGKNEISMKDLQSIGVEKGGSVYVQYTGNSNESIAVRVSGGQKIAALDLYQTANQSERLQKVKTYIEELQSQINSMEENHNAVHSGHSGVDYDYDEKNCALGATEIMLDHMLYSVSGKQILSGLSGTIDEKASQLLKSLDAMDQMMELFYQNKGLNDNAALINDRYPVQHLNIRYMRMFAGAFMYAGGNHIGIEWGSVAGLSRAVPFTSTDNGQFVSGSLFGWGIAHEIGHNINQSSYAIAEITNNYFSLLSQNQDSNDTTRFKYPDVYKKVTSNTVGRDSNVFTQLAMYWQLHLAYDQNYHYKLYDTQQEQLNSLFFARVDNYARHPETINIPENGVALKLNSDAEQNFMRLACAAANKDLTDYFKAWGIVPNADTVAFVKQFEKETRKLQYLDDDSMAYRLDKKAKMSEGTEIKANLVNETNSNQVTFTISNTNKVNDAMLGYEILRNGVPVGFVHADSGETTFTDTVSTVNNRVFTYSIVGYDRLLNQTAELKLNPIKISHDGSMDKALWEIETNLTSQADATTGSENATPCTPERTAINDIIDNNYQNVYTGTTNENQSEFIISLNSLADVTGVKFTNPSFKNVQIYVSQDKINWTLVKEDALTVGNENKLYFSQIVNNELQNNKSLVSYPASYVKVVSDEKELSLAEIDVLGPTGDNIDMAQSNSIGILSSDYQLDDHNIIPEGSLIFTGTYAGNPAYNVVELRYNEDDILSGYQAIFAENPGTEDLADVSQGTWVYYLIPEVNETGKIIENSFGYMDENDDFVRVELPASIKPQLYRVNDAMTNEGQRLVSDTFEVKIPTQLPAITLGNDKKGAK